MKTKNELLTTLAKQAERLARENITLKHMLTSVGVSCVTCEYCGWCDVTYTDAHDIDNYICVKYKRKRGGKNEFKGG